MRLRLFIFLACFFIVCPSFADDDCDNALKEGKREYSIGNYKRAKALFQNVSSWCGSSYGNAGEWIQKCDKALQPTLSVSASEIFADTDAGWSKITVFSNRAWELRSTSSSMFTVTRNDNEVTVNYNENTSTETRSDYFIIATTDGSKSIRINFSQAGQQVIAHLNVSSTSISASASGTTRTLTVDCNTSWEVEYPSATMYSVTRNGNTLTVTIHENTTKDSRSDFFNVKTLDGNLKQKISLSQDGKVSTHYATINSVMVDHNVWEDNLKGMRFHVKFNAYDVYNHKIKVCVYFSYSNGTALDGISGSGYITSNGKVTVQSQSTANYTNTTWNDYSIFMPYHYLNISPGHKNLELQAEVGILDKTTDTWLTDDYYIVSFTLSN